MILTQYGYIHTVESVYGYNYPDCLELNYRPCSSLHACEVNRIIDQVRPTLQRCGL